MCGIIGAIAQRDISAILLEGLKRLEYRGYDSAGLVTVSTNGLIKRLRTVGKVQALINKAQDNPIPGFLGVAHTRWATHGRPAEHNAHPLLSQEQLAVVHNGIIENHQELRQKLIEKGYVFESETDTEVAAHLIHYYYQQTQSLLMSVQQAAKEMKGAFAIGAVHVFHPDELIAIRQGSPLVIGRGVGENFIASDPLALRSFAQTVSFLEEGDVAHLTSSMCNVYNKDGDLVERIIHPLNDDAVVVSKGHYRHFMRGRTFQKRFIIIDEAQNLTSKQIKTLITRAGPGSKIICLGDIKQIDTPYLSETNSGLTFAVHRMREWPYSAHMTLSRGERSRLAQYAAENL